MILSPSGWRGVFSAAGDEEDPGKDISPAFGTIAAAGAFVFAGYIREKFSPSPAPSTVILGMDTRPTGPALADLMIRAFIARGYHVLFTGVSAAPEIMAFSRQRPPGYFAYISASHNPIGHNGIKFGFNGGVLDGPEAAKLIASLKDYMAAPDAAAGIFSFLEKTGSCELSAVYREEEAVKREALAAYRDFSVLVASGGESGAEHRDAAACPGPVFDAIKAGLAGRPLGIAADFNGSARAASIDGELIRSLGISFRSMNDTPGKIAHAIIPEGTSLDPCARFLSELHASDPSFTLGYVPDCDGDRGNLVIWDDRENGTRILQAQEVFALACVAELSHLVWTGILRPGENGGELPKAAVAVNGPTSMRIDRIARAFGVRVFRAEVGEANVVNLARRLRDQGYIVRILGEGSNGGNITHPSAVRDPLATLFALIKLLAVRSGGETGRGFFRIWQEKAGLAGGTGKTGAGDDFTISDIIASLPRFYTTGVSTPEAKLLVTTTDHRLLKEKYQRVFLAEWEEKKAGLEKYGIRDFQARSCVGSEEKRNLENFGDAETGGLKIVFTGKAQSGPDKEEKAFIWMRGSKTESVFRIMADAEKPDLERELIMWQRGMVAKADSM
jgi:phosphoglucomutase